MTLLKDHRCREKDPQLTKLSNLVSYKDVQHPRHHGKLGSFKTVHILPIRPIMQCHKLNITKTSECLWVIRMNHKMIIWKKTKAMKSWCCWKVRLCSSSIMFAKYTGFIDYFTLTLLYVLSIRRAGLRKLWIENLQKIQTI